jgi:uncharacterized protein YeaO (DUF488 family)
MIAKPFCANECAYSVREKEIKAMIKLKRAYEPANRDDGTRFLVERLWPRGVKKHALRLDAWLKDVAPSSELRQWFGHDPAKWSEFQRRYREELKAKEGALEPILKGARRGRVTLVYSSHDQEHNNAVVLKGYVESHLAASNEDAASRLGDHVPMAR